MNARFRAKPEPPFEIPPKSTYDIACALNVFRPGEFSGQIHCYVCDPHLREIVLKVSGTVKVPAARKERTIAPKERESIAQGIALGTGSQ